VFKALRLALIASVLEMGYALALAMLAGWPWSLFAAGGAVVIRRARKGRIFWAHGIARFAQESDLRRHGMIGGNTGLMVGRIESPKPSIFDVAPALFNRRMNSKDACDWFLRAWSIGNKGQLVRLSKSVHTAIFAPTGAGKGAGIIVPHLLDCPESMVCIDLKGELASITAKHRRKRFGHEIVMLDPYRVVTKKPATMNALDFIERDSPDVIDACRDIGEMLVVRTGNEPEPHWNDGAEGFIAGATAAVIAQGAPGFCSLQSVCEILSDPDKVQQLIALMRKSDGMLSRMGGQLAHFKDKELASMLTSANRHLRFLNTPVIAESTSSSSFDPSSLRNGRMTVYLILPPEHMRAQMGLLRLWIGILARSVIRGGLQRV
jgi:type IV secretion system protein VirD4